jgi:parallel beta-helix repeat protein
MGGAAVKKVTSFVVCFLLVLNLITAIDLHFEMSRPAAGSVIYVGGSGGGNYTKIQDGINAASPGSMVYVYNGTYIENVYIDKTINLTGEGRNSTIIIADNTIASTLDIQGHWANVSGFKVKNGSEGIRIWGSNCTISNNIAEDNGYGICVWGGISNNVGNNIVLSNHWGIDVEAWFNRVHNNTIIYNIWGIYMESSHNIIIDNIASYNAYGIYLYGSGNNNITNNEVHSNENEGIYVSHLSDGNHIINNSARNNTHGISIYEYSDENVASGNTVWENDYGIHITWDSYNNLVYHNNLINNSVQADCWDPSDNDWHNPLLLEGNYWSDYEGVDDGSGFGKHAIAGDNIGDTEIPHPTNFFDFYPLMDPYGYCMILSPGWNLISIPLVQKETYLERILTPLEGKFATALYYNNSDNLKPWKHHHISKPFHLNDLKEIDSTMGFFIYISTANETVFVPGGHRPSHNHSINLYNGWNMVGYPSLTNYNRTLGLNNLNFGYEIDSIQWFDSSTKTWHDLGSDDYFQIGYGYWVHAKTDCLWEVPL